MQLFVPAFCATLLSHFVAHNRSNTQQRRTLVSVFVSEGLSVTPQKPKMTKQICVPIAVQFTKHTDDDIFPFLETFLMLSHFTKLHKIGVETYNNSKYGV